MKKVIAVAAGLMLTGALVSTASAAVSFSGDARVRGYLQSDYDFGRTVPIVEGTEFPRTRTNENQNLLNSRVRVKIDADAKGGSYVRSRIKIGDGTFGAVPNSKTAVSTDYAYIGVPMGPITIEGGRMPAHITLFFVNDDRHDMVVAKWQNDMTDVQFWYRSVFESLDNVDDNDVIGYYGLLRQKFGGDWGMTLAGAYIDDQRASDLSGFTGTAHVDGPAGPISLAAEFAYQEGDLAASDDDGYGGYLEAGMDFGATSVSLNGGWAQDGFAANGDFGFIMLGGGSSITPGAVSNFGFFNDDIANTTWFGGKAAFKASEAMTLTGILAYGDFEDAGDGFEISGKLAYGISDGAKITWDIGYLAWSSDTINEESPFGTALTLEVAF